MNGFLTNIITRHTNGNNLVTPRERTIFEPYTGTSTTIQSGKLLQHSKECLGNLSNHIQTDKSNETHQDGKNLNHFLKFEKESERQKPISFVEFLNKSQNNPGNSHSKNHVDWPNENPREKSNFKKKSNLNEELSPKSESSLLLDLLNASRGIIENQKDKLIAKKTIENSSNFSSKQFNPIGTDIINGGSLKQKSINNLSNVLPIENSPNIKIHIGRIEIKAINQHQEKITSKSARQKPLLSLEQFLIQRDNK